MAKPMYVWNGSAWEAVAPTVPESPISYQASAPASPSTGDIWVDSDGDVGTFDRQLVRYRFVASGGETSLSGVDANGFTLAYVPGAEQVYLNGVLLVRTSDYTATNGTSITALSPALAANDVVEVFAYNSFNLANTYTKAEVDGSLALKSDVSATGLVHINTTNFSAVSSVSLPDNTFTSTYDSYLLIVNTELSTSAETRFRVRAAGTDATGVNYDYYSNAFTNTFNNQAAATGQTSAYINGSSGKMNFQFYIYDIAKATDTRFNAFGNIGYTNTLASSGYHGLSTAYDSCTIFRSTGAMTGSIIAFGVKK